MPKPEELRSKDLRPSNLQPWMEAAIAELFKRLPPKEIPCKA